MPCICLSTSPKCFKISSHAHATVLQNFTKSICSANQLVLDHSPQQIHQYSASKPDMNSSGTAYAAAGLGWYGTVMEGSSALRYCSACDSMMMRRNSSPSICSRSIRMSAVLCSTSMLLETRSLARLAKHHISVRGHVLTSIGLKAYADDNRQPCFGEKKAPGFSPEWLPHIAAKRRTRQESTSLLGLHVHVKWELPDASLETRLNAPLSRLNVCTSAILHTRRLKHTCRRG